MHYKYFLWDNILHFRSLGHSLGAGVAILLTLDLLQGELASSLPENTEVRCYAYAPPPVFRPGRFGDELPDSVRDRIVIVINNHDCIPRMSLGNFFSFFMSSQHFLIVGSLTRFLASLRAIDELNLSFSQQLQIIMNARDLENLNTDETEDEDQDREKDQIETESDLELSELMDKVVKAVNVARQDNYPYLQHPGKIIYLKKTEENSQEAEESEDVSDSSHVALAQDSLRVPQSLPLLARMVIDHRDNNYRLAIRSLQSQSPGTGLGFKGLKQVLN